MNWPQLDIKIVQPYFDPKTCRLCGDRLSVQRGLTAFIYVFYLLKKKKGKKGRHTTSAICLLPKCHRLPRLAQHATWTPCNVSCLQRPACCAVKYSLLNCQRCWTPAQHAQHDGSAILSSVTCTSTLLSLCPLLPHIHTYLTPTPFLTSPLPMPVQHLNATLISPKTYLCYTPSPLHFFFLKK